LLHLRTEEDDNGRIISHGDPADLRK
jgi:hypothetical protein